MKVTTTFVFAFVLTMHATACLAEKFEIQVSRSKKSSGTLTFLIDGNQKFQTTCWWASDNVIPAKTYTGCSTTLMAKKKFKAVYLPDEQTGKKGIFIHQGSSPKHSQGCIVISKVKIEQIYDLVPRNQKQIRVVIKDIAPGQLRNRPQAQSATTQTPKQAA